MTDISVIGPIPINSLHNYIVVNCEDVPFLEWHWIVILGKGVVYKLGGVVMDAASCTATATF